MNKQAVIDWPTVLKLMGGGALLGTGIGAGSSLVNYLSNLNAKAKAKQDTSRDDDVLYLDLPAKPGMPGLKQAASGSPATFAFGGLGTMLGAYLAYNAVRGAYSNVRRKQLQKDLDAAQHSYLGGLDQSAQMAKAAAAFSGVNKVVGSGYLAGLLTILGSAVLANKVLQKQFPDRPQRSPHQPRKIVIRTMRGDGIDKEVPAAGGMTPDATEGLTRLNLANTKSASWGLTDLVAHAAIGGCQSFKKNLQELGLDNALELIKGASDREVSPLAENLAISWIAHDPLVSTAIAPYLAAQLFEDSPTFAKAATCLANSPDVDEGELEDLIGLTEVVAQTTREACFAPIMSRLPESHIKSAASRARQMAGGGGLGNHLVVADAISSLLDRMGNGAPAQPNLGSTTSAPASQDSDSILRPKRTVKKRQPTFEVDDKGAEEFLEQNRDMIDQALGATA